MRSYYIFFISSCYYFIRFSGDTLIMRKILSVGMILLFVSACLPHMGSLPEKTQADLSPTAKVQSSLFTQSELDEIFSDESVPPQMEIIGPFFSSTHGGSIRRRTGASY